MTMRKRMTAGLLGAALIALGLSALGVNSAPNFGDPLPGLTADQQTRFVAGQANFSGTDTPATGLGPVFNSTGVERLEPLNNRLFFQFVDHCSSLLRDTQTSGPAASYSRF